MQRTSGPGVRLRQLLSLRLVTVRLAKPAPAQLGLMLDGTRRLPVLDRRDRGTEFIQLSVSQIANPPESTGMAFWSINPYIGCEFGCSYCYARDTHRWTVERNGLAGGSVEPRFDFERRIFVKHDAATVLRKTLEPSRVGNRLVLIGTATDPYQPAERRFGVTRAILEALLGFRGLSIGITTKSPLVARDVRLLAMLAQLHRVSVSISIISSDPAVIRRFEPRTPLPHARLRAVRALAEAGIDVGLLIAPILPGITDGWGALGGLMAAGKEAGARRADGFALRLAPVARAGFLPVLSHDRALAARYQANYRGPQVGPAYQRALIGRLRTLQAIHGFPLNKFDPPTAARRPAPPSPPVAEPVTRLAL
ncbi:MAG: radical SAM protein [Gemmatimonadetes bacterium]|nr:radical SAM protein [Gemmatimonadota bacterium]